MLYHKKMKIKIICLALLSTFLCLPSLSVFAQNKDELHFPGYKPITGVIGENDDNEYLTNYIPKVIEIIMKAVSVLVFGMFIFSGVRFIYAGSDEEQLKQSKMFFSYALMGIVFIVIAYSLMKGIYYIFL